MYHIKHQVLCVSISYKIAPLIITCGLQRQHRLLHVPFDSNALVFCLQELKLVLLTISVQLSLLTLDTKEFHTTHSIKKNFFKDSISQSVLIPFTQPSTYVVHSWSFSRSRIGKGSTVTAVQKQWWSLLGPRLDTSSKTYS